MLIDKRRKNISGLKVNVPLSSLCSVKKGSLIGFDCVEPIRHVSRDNEGQSRSTVSESEMDGNGWKEKVEASGTIEQNDGTYEQF